MEFYMPVKVYDEEDCVARHAAELAGLGHRALLVTGRRSARACGALDDVCGALKSNGVEWTLFDEVEENPSRETVMRGRDLGLSAGADCVIGIGGGSPMDAAKAIALMMGNPTAGIEFLYDKLAAGQTRKAAGDPLPLALIPTTCGTGSEVTGVSVLTNHEKKTKGSIPHQIFARVALLDGKYLRTASEGMFADTSMDALCHLVESYLNTGATDYSRMCVEAGLSLWAKSKDVILGAREITDVDRSRMLRASMMAGMAIAHTGTSLPHALSYRLTYNEHISHGKACGYFLVGYMRAAEKAAHEGRSTGRFMDVARILALIDMDDLDALEDYYQKTCQPGQVTMELLEQACAEVAANPGKLAKAPFPVDEAALRSMAGL